MQVQTVFCNSLSILQKVGIQLRLSLSEDPALIAQQIQRIRRAQTHFLKLDQKIVDWLDPQQDETTYYAHSLIIQVTQAMANEAHTLLLLAEEFPLDPEGTAACLNDAQIRIQRLLQQINTLKIEGLKGLKTQKIKLKGCEEISLEPLFADQNTSPQLPVRIPYAALVAAKVHQSTGNRGLAATTRGAFYSET